MEIGTLFLFDHAGQRVELLPGAPQDLFFAHEVDRFQKERVPRLNQHETTIAFKNAVNLGQNLLQIGFELRQMVQTTLHNHDINGAVGELQVSGITDIEQRDRKSTRLNSSHLG